MHDEGMRRKNRNMMLGLAGVAFLAAGIGLAFAWDYLRAVHQGPVSVTPEQLAAAETVKALPAGYVRVPVTEVREVGVTTSARQAALQYDKSRFALIAVGKRWMVAEVRPGYKGGDITGWVGPWRDNLRRDALTMIARTAPKEHAQALPYQIDGTRDESSEVWVAYGLIGDTALFGLFFVFTAFFLNQPAGPPEELTPAADDRLGAAFR